MSAQIDTSTDSLIAASQNKPKPNNASGTANVFASLIQGQIPSNIIFTRIDAQLDLPQKSAPLSFEEPLEAAAEQVNRPNDENQEAASSETSTNDNINEDEDKQAASSDPDATGNEQNYGDELAIVAPTETGAVEKTVPGLQAQNATATGTTPAQAAIAEAAKPNEAAAKGQATAATKVASDSNGSINIENMDAPDVADTKLAGQAQQSNKGTNNIGATVSNKVEELVSQPANTLAASATVAAQTARESQNTGDVKLASVADKPMADAEGTANNAFTKGQNQNNNNSGAQNNAAQNAGQKTGAEMAQTNVNLSALENANFNSALNAATSQPPAPLTSAQQAPISQPASVDPMAAAGTTTQSSAVQAKTATTPTPTARPNVPPQIISDQVAVNIQRAIGAGNDRISIQLRPQDLGRIEVVMEMGKDGRMTAVITVDKPETLDMMKSDAKGLIQSLNDAGLQTDAGSLSFNLKSNGEDASQYASNNDNQNNNADTEFSLDGENDGVEAAPLLAEGEEAQLDADGHLDVQV